MMTGDAYKLPIKIETAEGIADPSAFSEIEVFFGDVRKTLSKGQIVYDNEQQAFLVDITQNDTFRQKGKAKIQLRVKTTDGEVVGIDAGTIDLPTATSKVVL